jgi:hypothetical protein
LIAAARKSRGRCSAPSVGQQRSPLPFHHGDRIRVGHAAVPVTLATNASANANGDMACCRLTSTSMANAFATEHRVNPTNTPSAMWKVRTASAESGVAPVPTCC